MRLRRAADRDRRALRDLADRPGQANIRTYVGEPPAVDALVVVTAVDLRPRGRQAKREAITATGPTEVEALGALVALLEARATRD